MFDSDFEEAGPPLAPDAVIELEGVSKQYGGEWPAITEIDMLIAKGEFVFVLGATGAGKTTLMRMLYRSELPDAGTARVLGYDLAAAGDREIADLRRRIGIVFQDFKLLPERTAYENLEFVLRAVGTRQELIPVRIQETMTQVGILHRRNAFPSQLSGGEQQKVSIARALVKNPELILADEPTGNIDPKGTADILNLLKEANYQGATVVMATHDAELAQGARRRCITLDAGRIVRDES